MPHDCRGQSLAKGDIVTVTFQVDEVFAEATACNTNLRVLPHAGTPEGTYLPLITLNAGLCTKIDPTPRAAPAEAATIREWAASAPE